MTKNSPTERSSRTLTSSEILKMFAATDDAETDREWRASINVSRDELHALRRRAAKAGDLDLVTICRVALHGIGQGSETARLYCADLIAADAAAQR